MAVGIMLIGLVWLGLLVLGIVAYGLVCLVEWVGCRWFGWECIDKETYKQWQKRVSDAEDHRRSVLMALRREER